MASLERIERARQLYRARLCFLLFLFPWTQAGCEKDLADLPVSDSLSVEWGDSEFVVSEPILSIPLKNTKITKKKKKYELRVKTKNGDFQGWVIATGSRRRKSKKDRLCSEKKGSKCSLLSLRWNTRLSEVQINS